MSLSDLAALGSLQRLLSAAAYNSNRLGLTQALEAPGRRAMWRMERGRYDAGFRAYIDRILSERSGHWAADGVDAWRRAVAAEKETA